MNKNTFNLGEFTTLKQKQDVEDFQRQAKAYINSLPRVGQMAVNTITNTVWVITDIYNYYVAGSGRTTTFFTVATRSRSNNSDTEYLKFSNLLQDYICRVMNGETETEAEIDKILSTAPDCCRYLYYDSGLDVMLFNGERKTSVGLQSFIHEKISRCFRPSKDSCYDWTTSKVSLK